MVQTSGRKRRRGQHARLTALQRRFVDELLQDPEMNAHQAAQRAGTRDTGRVWSTRTMQKPAVMAAIAAAKAARARRVEVKQDEVLRELLRVALSDIGKAFGPDGQLLPLSEIPEDVRRAIAGVEVEEATEKRGELRKVKLWDKPSALDKLMRHLGAYKDSLKLEGGVTLEQLVPKRKPPPAEGSK